jgi:hypothetical protein
MVAKGARGGTPRGNDKRESNQGSESPTLTSIFRPQFLNFPERKSNRSRPSQRQDSPALFIGRYRKERYLNISRTMHIELRRLTYE